MINKPVPTQWKHTPWNRGAQMVIHWPGTRLHGRDCVVTGTSFSTNEGARLNAHVDGIALGTRFEMGTRPLLVRECDRMVGWTELVAMMGCDPRLGDRV